MNRIARRDLHPIGLSVPGADAARFFVLPAHAFRKRFSWLRPPSAPKPQAYELDRPKDAQAAVRIEVDRFDHLGVLQERSIHSAGVAAANGTAENALVLLLQAGLRTACTSRRGHASTIRRLADASAYAAATRLSVFNTTRGTWPTSTRANAFVRSGLGSAMPFSPCPRFGAAVAPFRSSYPFAVCGIE